MPCHAATLAHISALELMTVLLRIETVPIRGHEEVFTFLSF